MTCHPPYDQTSLHRTSINQYHENEWTMLISATNMNGPGEKRRGRSPRSQNCRNATAFSPRDNCAITQAGGGDLGPRPPDR